MWIKFKEKARALWTKIKGETPILLAKLGQRAKVFWGKTSEGTLLFWSKLKKQTAVLLTKSKKQTALFLSAVKEKLQDFWTIIKEQTSPLPGKLKEETIKLWAKIKKQTVYLYRQAREKPVAFLKETPGKLQVFFRQLPDKIKAINWRELVKSNTSCHFFSMLGLVLVRYFWLGIQYYPQLDDYIQYYNHRAFGGSVLQVIEKMGLLKARPFAGLADITIWNSMWENMAVALVIISVLYVVSGLLFKRVFEKYFPVSTLFLVLYTLVPWGFEGVYWISASSRIVVGLFFAALSAYFLQKFIEKNKTGWVIWSIVAQLLAFGFYEQTLVFSITLNLLLFMGNYKKLKWKNLWALGAFVNVVAYYLIINIQKIQSIYDVRMKILLPSHGDAFWQNMSMSMEAFTEMFTQGTWLIMTEGFHRAMELIAANRNYIGLALVVVFIHPIIMKKPEKTWGNGVVGGLIVGYLLYLAPMTPFYVIENSYISMRNMVTSFCGLALMADVIFCCLIGKRRVYALLCACIAFYFTVGSFSETYDYKYSYEQDAQVASQLKYYVEPGVRIAVFGLEPYWNDGQNYKYSEHILSACSSDWALLGMMRNVSNQGDIGSIMPISDKEPWKLWNRQSKQLYLFDRIFHYENGRLRELTYKKTAPYQYKLFYNGQPYGELTDIWGEGTFTVYE